MLSGSLQLLFTTKFIESGQYQSAATSQHLSSIYSPSARFELQICVLIWYHVRLCSQLNQGSHSLEPEPK